MAYVSPRRYCGLHECQEWHDDEDGRAYIEKLPGHFEVFEAPRDYALEDTEPGFYYWYCEPGCLPDSDVYGPFETSQQAYEACVGW